MSAVPARTYIQKELQQIISARRITYHGKEYIMNHVKKLTMGNANINSCVNDLMNKCTVMYHVTTVRTLKSKTLLVKIHLHTHNSRLTINVVRINIQQSRQKYQKE